MFLIQTNEKSRGWKYPTFLWLTWCRVYSWDKMGKKAHPIYQNPAMTASTYVKPKVVLFMEKKRGSRKIKTKTPPQTYSNLHIHTHSHMDALIPIYPSKPPSTHLNPILITATSTYTPTLTYTHFLSRLHTCNQRALGLPLCFINDTMILQQLEDRKLSLESHIKRVKSS